MKYDISESLTRIREERHFTPQEMAIVLGYSTTYVYYLLSGNRHVGMKSVERIAINLRVPIESILGFTPEKKTSHHSAEAFAPIPKGQQAGKSAILRMLERHGDGVPYLANNEQAWHEHNAASVRGARRMGCHCITEAITAGGGGQG